MYSQTDKKPLNLLNIHRIWPLLLALDAACLILHFIWPEYTWGQGRSSYFNLQHSITFASWYLSVKLLISSLLAFAAFIRFRIQFRENLTEYLLAGILFLAVSFNEFTRILYRTGILNDPSSGPFAVLILVGVFIIGCIFVLYSGSRPQGIGTLRRYTQSAALMLLISGLFSPAVAHSDTSHQFALILHWGLSLIGTSAMIIFLWMILVSAELTLTPPKQKRDSILLKPDKKSQKLLLYFSVGSISFVFLFLEILLFRCLEIMGNYLNATGVIAIALLGGAGGGLAAYLGLRRKSLHPLQISAILMPVSVLISLGSVVWFQRFPTFAGMVLILPFFLITVVTATLLASPNASRLYFVSLVGAGLAPLLINPALTVFREESALLLLTALSAVSATAVLKLIGKSGLAIKTLLLGVAVAALSAGIQNPAADWINIVRAKLTQKYPEMEILYSRSNYVSRYDIVKRNPDSGALKSYENGRTIDTIRKWKPDSYRIDPRFPHTLFDDPHVLIIGLSGDAITKTARHYSSKVVGLEINPAIADLQSDELSDLNGNSYQNIDVHVTDGRTFVQQSRESFDIITLLNTHFSKGSSSQREPVPEYLYTREAFQHYYDRLTDDGIICIEQPISSPSREPSIWKMVRTAQSALTERTDAHPADHFFIFQWRTRYNNYYQLLIKKTPFTHEEHERLLNWLNQVDRIRDLEKAADRYLGPIKAVTTILYSPYISQESVFKEILYSRNDSYFLENHKLQAVDDNAPFLFDVKPDHPETRSLFRQVLVFLLVVLPLFLVVAVRAGNRTAFRTPHLGIVGLTGLGFLLVEMVLIQRFEILLGSPVGAFATILGSLLAASGLGSLWSSRIRPNQTWIYFILLELLLLAHLYLVPSFFPVLIQYPAPVRFMFAGISIFPLGFLMGIPFPLTLSHGGKIYSDSIIALLYGFNGLIGALAVPLALNLSLQFNLNAVYLIGCIIYLFVWVAIHFLDTARSHRIIQTSGILTIAILLTVPILGRDPSVSGSERIQPGKSFPKVYALSYGTSPFRESSAISGGSRTKRIRYEWMFWLIQDGPRTILVDTGFNDEKTAEKWRFHKYLPPPERLKQAGVQPDSVTDIILTHLHWDHCGSLSSYPNAVVWLQEKEFDWARESLGVSGRNKHGLQMQDMEVLLKIQTENRLKLINGQYSVSEDVVIQHVGGHTPGFQCVNVSSPYGPICILADNANLFKSVQFKKPGGNAQDKKENAEAIQTALLSAGSPFLVLPGHDPRTMNLFPEVSDGIVRITY